MLRERDADFMSNLAEHIFVGYVLVGPNVQKTMKCYRWSEAYHGI